MFSPGDDVIVTFEGVDRRGVVMSHHHGWVIADVEFDPRIIRPRAKVGVRDTEVRYPE